MTRPERISQLDGLRALAFTAVFAHHALHAPLLWMGVDLFFVLSGFLITRNLLRLRDTTPTGAAMRTFWFRRVLRIVPPYYLAVVVIFIVQRTALDDAPWFFGFASNIRDALYGPIEGPLNTLWSIAVEEQFYLVWPWLVLLLPRRWLAPVFVAAIVIATVCRIALTPFGFDWVYRLMPCRMDLLACGALLALVEARDPKRLESARRWFVIAAAAAVIVFAVLSVTTAQFRTSLDLPLFNVVGFGLSTVFFTAIVGYVRATHTGLAVTILRHPVLQYIGMISYMAYLTHVLAIEAASHLHLGGAGVAIGGYALTIAIATASWYLVEKPLQRLR